MRMLSRLALLVLASAFSIGSAHGQALEQNTNRPGNNIANFRAPTVEACQANCQRNDKCMAFTYVKAAKWCWLKYTPGKTVADAACTSGVMRQRLDEAKKRLTQESVRLGTTRRTGPGGPPPKPQFQLNTSFKGNDFQNLPAKHPLLCMIACHKNPRCKAFTFVKTSNTCFLKDAVPAAVKDPNCVSGQVQRAVTSVAVPKAIQGPLKTAVAAGGTSPAPGGTEKAPAPKPEEKKDEAKTEPKPEEKKDEAKTEPKPEEKKDEAKTEPKPEEKKDEAKTEPKPEEKKDEAKTEPKPEEKKDEAKTEPKPEEKKDEAKTDASGVTDLNKIMEDHIAGFAAPKDKIWKAGWALYKQGPEVFEKLGAPADSKQALGKALTKLKMAIENVTKFIQKAKTLIRSALAPKDEARTENLKKLLQEGAKDSLPKALAEESETVKAMGSLDDLSLAAGDSDAGKAWSKTFDEIKEELPKIARIGEAYIRAGLTVLLPEDKTEYASATEAYKKWILYAKKGLDDVVKLVASVSQGKTGEKPAQASSGGDLDKILEDHIVGFRAPKDKIWKAGWALFKQGPEVFEKIGAPADAKQGLAKALTKLKMAIENIAKFMQKAKSLIRAAVAPKDAAGNEHLKKLLAGGAKEAVPKALAEESESVKAMGNLGELSLAAGDSDAAKAWSQTFDEIKGELPKVAQIGEAYIRAGLTVVLPKDKEEYASAAEAYKKWILYAKKGLEEVVNLVASVQGKTGTKPASSGAAKGDVDLGKVLEDHITGFRAPKDKIWKAGWALFKQGPEVFEQIGAPANAKQGLAKALTKLKLAIENIAKFMQKAKSLIRAALAPKDAAGNEHLKKVLAGGAKEAVPKALAEESESVKAMGNLDELSLAAGDSDAAKSWSDTFNEIKGELPKIAQIGEAYIRAGLSVVLPKDKEEYASAADAYKKWILYAKKGLEEVVKLVASVAGKTGQKPASSGAAKGDSDLAKILEDHIAGFRAPKDKIWKAGWALFKQGPEVFEQIGAPANAKQGLAKALTKLKMAIENIAKFMQKAKSLIRAAVAPKDAAGNEHLKKLLAGGAKEAVPKALAEESESVKAMGNLDELSLAAGDSDAAKSWSQTFDEIKGELPKVAQIGEAYIRAGLTVVLPKDKEEYASAGEAYKKWILYAKKGLEEVVKLVAGAQGKGGEKAPPEEKKEGTPAEEPKPEESVQQPKQQPNTPRKAPPPPPEVDKEEPPQEGGGGR
jgi:hypothetical protein